MIAKNLNLGLKTILLDANFKVHEHLALRREQYSAYLLEDAKLEERQLQLDSDSPLDNQTSAQIESLRKRLKVGAFAPPIEFSESVITSAGGVTVLRSLLTTAYTTMTKEDRLDWLVVATGLIITPRLRLALVQFEITIQRLNLGQSRNFYFGGQSGSGKTTLLDWIAAVNLPLILKFRTLHSVLRIDAPGNTKMVNALIQRLIIELGGKYKQSEKPQALMLRLRTLLRKCGVKIIMIDEIEYLSTVDEKRTLVDLSNLMTHIPIIIASPKPEVWLQDNDSRQGRWKAGFELKAYEDTELQLLLIYIELLLPFPVPSNLHYGDAIELIAKASQGIMREIMSIIIVAASQAIEDESKSIQMRHLRYAASLLD